MALGSIQTAEGRKSIKQWIYLVVALWTIGFLLLAVFSGYALIRTAQLNKQLCVVTDDNRTIVSNILGVAKQQALEGASGAFERNEIRQRYNELLALIPPLKCTTQGGPQELEP